MQHHTHHSSCQIKCQVRCPGLVPKPRSAHQRGVIREGEQGEIVEKTNMCVRGKKGEKWGEFEEKKKTC